MEFPLSETEYLDGQVLLVDKPLNWTSFDVVKKIRSTLQKKFDLKKIKVGHAGTLDPRASGLLIVCTGKQTKNINQIQGQKKTYTGTIKLGYTTASYDAETAEENKKPTVSISDAKIIETAQLFVGTIDQKPPIYSAIKINGERLYKKARKGEEVEIRTREVEVHSFEITKIEKPFVYFSVDCSKGTYIRSLANDLGEKLGCGAYLYQLRRTHIGDFSVENASMLEFS